MILFLLACIANGSTPPYDGWREIPPPRADLQCWTRFNTYVVCAPALNATHGATL